MQPDLFQHESSEAPLPIIGGLSYVPDFISSEEEQTLLQQIDLQSWLSDLKRRVQHYGWRYDYQARKVDASMRLGQLPDWLSPICQRLQDEGYFSKMPDQVIVNEYLPGQGISAHIDCIPCFGETIASLSLGSHCIMELSNEGNKHPILLELHSLLVLSKDARYHWKHSIPARKTDHHFGVAYPRERRISLTFRSILLD